MFRSAIRFTLVAMLVCRVAMATDIEGKLILNDTFDPYIKFNQYGTIDYQWVLEGSSLGFSLLDITGDNNRPFTIDPGSDHNLLYVTGSKIGIGTPAPEQKLQIQDGYLRFEHSGGTWQDWDLLPDHISFDIRDATNGTTPFRIKPGAPSNALYMTAEGTIGLGTNLPAAGLHLKKPAQAATAEIMARFETSDDPVGSLAIVNNSAGDGVFIPKIIGRSASQNAAMINEALITNDVGTSPAIVYNAALGAGGPVVTRPLVVYRNNSVAKVTIAANGNITATSFNPSSSRAIKHDIKDLDSQKASDALRQLTPVEFIYNDDESAEGRVGFIAEDVPDLVANQDRKSVPIMDVVALLTRVVKDQQQTIDEQRKRLDAMERSLAEVKSQEP